MNDQVEEVKAKSDIVAIIGERVKLTKAGRNYRALCPFHSEKTPSFMVSPEIQIYKCFGCGASGDVFSFLEDYEGMDFAEALKYLAERSGITLTPFKSDRKTEKEELLEVNALAAKLYHYLLLNHPLGKPGLSYLTEKRGIKLETIDAFGLGFAPDSPKILSDFLVSKKKVNQGLIEKAGLTVNSGGRYFDRFRGRVIFPLMDHRGNSVGLAGRILPEIERDLPAGRQVAKYINSPETPVYHKGNLLYGANITRSDLKRSGFALIVEGEIDAISVWQAGIKNVVALKGTAFTPEQAKVLSRFTSEVVLALDSDIAGDSAARRGITIATDAGLEVKVLEMKNVKDPDEAVRADPEKFKSEIKKAVSVWDFMIDSTLTRYNKNSGSGIAKISRELIEVLSLIKDKIVQAHYLEIVSEKLSVPADAVIAELEKAGAKTEPSVKIETNPAGIKAPERNRHALLEEDLLATIFRYDPSLLKGTNPYTKLIKSPLALRLLEELGKYFENNKDFDSALFAKNLPRELFDGFTDIIFKQSVEDSGSKDDFGRNIKTIVAEIEKIESREELSKYEKQIKSLEKSGDKQKLEKVKRKFALVSSKIAGEL